MKRFRVWQTAPVKWIKESEFLPAKKLPTRPIMEMRKWLARVATPVALAFLWYDMVKAVSVTQGVSA